MSGRGIGLAAASLPDSVVVAAALLTQLGDLWFLFVLLASLYWFGGPLLDRRRAATLVGLTLAALALTTGLKALFALPRPPGAGVVEGAAALPAALRPLYEQAATADGHGFPSGHALGSTVVYGGLALLSNAATRRRRFAAAGAIVAVVAASRVVIGVHYLVDVLAGVAVGAGLLWGGHRLLEGDAAPGRAFWLAVVAGLFAALAGGYALDPMGVLGATLGARLAWSVVGDAVLASPPVRREGAVAAAVGLPVFGGVFVGTFALEPAPWIGFLANGVVLAGVLALPVAAGRV